MPKPFEPCRFRDLPDGAFFIEKLSPDHQINPNGSYEIHEKCGDHELVLVGSLSDGVVRLDAARGEPTPDHISGSSPVVFVPSTMVA